MRSIGSGQLGSEQLQTAELGLRRSGWMPFASGPEHAGREQRLQPDTDTDIDIGTAAAGAAAMYLSPAGPAAGLVDADACVPAQSQALPEQLQQQLPDEAAEHVEVPKAQKEPRPRWDQHCMPPHTPLQGLDAELLVKAQAGCLWSLAVMHRAAICTAAA